MKDYALNLGVRGRHIRNVIKYCMRDLISDVSYMYCL